MPTVTDAWFDRVYTDPLYLTLYQEEDSARAELEAREARSLCAPPEGGWWLDVCCGFGRHAEVFRRLGQRVVGVDRSPLMVRRADQRAAAARLDISYVRGDVRALPFRDAFCAASLMFDSFGYFENDVEHDDALRSIAMCLITGGTLLLHLTNREQILRLWTGEDTRVCNGYTVHRHYELDLAAGRYRWRQEIRGDGRQTVWSFDIRLFTAAELTERLTAAGFCDIRLYGNWDGTPYVLDAPYLIVTARKAAFRELPGLAD